GYDGTVVPSTLALDGHIRADSGSASGLAHRLGLSSAVGIGAVHGDGSASGTLRSPRLALSLEAGNVTLGGRGIEKLSGDLRVQNGVVSLDNVHGKAAGGAL